MNPSHKLRYPSPEGGIGTDKDGLQGAKRAWFGRENGQHPVVYFENILHTETN